MGRYISPAVWEAIRREWRLGRDSVQSVARRYEISQTSLFSRAKRKGWGRRCSEFGNPLLSAEVALGDVVFEMNRKLAMIRDPEALTTLQTIGEDARLIFTVARDIRRAIAEIKKAQADAGANMVAAGGAGVAYLDTDAALAEFFELLDRRGVRLADSDCKSTDVVPSQKADPDARDYRHSRAQTPRGA